MKKIVATLALLAGIGTTQIQAQTLSGGIKAEANLSNFILKDLGGMKSDMNAGASLGGFLKIDLGEHFALQPELLVNYKSSKAKLSGAKNDYEYWGAEIPVYALGQWKAGNGRFYAGVGPYVSCGFSAKYKTGDVDLYDTDALRRFDFGGGALVGYEFRNGIQINAGYKIGLLDNMDTGRDDASMYNQALSLGVGFRF